MWPYPRTALSKDCLVNVLSDHDFFGEIAGLLIADPVRCPAFTAETMSLGMAGASQYRDLC